jgi:hypothetical protein
LRWVISALEPPRLRRRCAGCRADETYVCSDRFRVNANGRRLDVWLIYRCGRCDRRVNAPILERAPVASIDPLVLAAFEANCADAVRRFAFDSVVYGRVGQPIDPPIAVAHIPDGHPDRVTLELADPVRVRLDRLLARELGIARPRLGSLILSITPPPHRGPRSLAATGMEVELAFRS